METKIIKIIVILMLATVALCGCNTPTPEKKIHDIVLEFNIDKTEILTLDFELINSTFKNNSGVFLTSYDEGYLLTEDNGVGFTINILKTSESEYGIVDAFRIDYWEYENQSFSKFTVGFLPNVKYQSPGNEEILKEKIKDLAIDLAKKSNVTLNWEEAKWVVNYTC